MVFPPVNSGGLIEAATIAAQSDNSLAFPPVNSGGLIEAAVLPAVLTWSPARFPPVNSGGLIEARDHTIIAAAAHRVSAGEFRRPH